MIALKLNSKSYSQQVPVLKNTSINIAASSFTTIRGDSGSGKSTLIRILALQDMNFSGTYLLDGEDVKIMDDLKIQNHKMKTLSLVHQDFNLLEALTVYKNLEIVLMIHQTPYRDRQQKIVEVMKNVNLSLDLLTRYPQQLSGGQKQRVAIARALLANPTIIIADEPTGSLDQNNAIGIIELLLSLNVTLVIGTHDPSIADLGSNQYIVKNGSVHEV